MKLITMHGHFNIKYSYIVNCAVELLVLLGLLDP
jgi:hypothetical protein